MLSGKRRCAQSQGLRLIARRAFDREACARSYVTAPKSHGASKLAKAARATRKTRVCVACARSRVLRLSAALSNASSLGLNVGVLEIVSSRLIAYALDRNSLALERTNRGYDSFLAQFNPFKPHFTPRTYNTLKCVRKQLN